MIEIPKHIIMSPPVVYACPDIGRALIECDNFLYGDLIPAVFLMSEISKRTASFWYPFLQVTINAGLRLLTRFILFAAMYLFVTPGDF
jgi:hypothetical protein